MQQLYCNILNLAGVSIGANKRILVTFLGKDMEDRAYELPLMLSTDCITTDAVN